MGESAAKFRPEVDLDEFERRLRAAAPAAQPRPDGSDPLAELARLVGGEGMTKREDPFQALFRAQSAVAELRHAPEVEPPRAEAPQPEQAAPQVQHYALREPYFEQQPQAEDPQAQAYYNESFASEPLPYQEAEPAWTPEAQSLAGEEQQGWPAAFGEPALPPAASAFRRKVMLGMASVLALGVIAIGGTLALRGKSASQDVATIQADADPAKVKPAQAEDSSAPTGQALFDRKGGGNVSKVVANTEQPADLGVTVKNARVVGAASGIATPTPPSPSGAAPAAPPQPGSAQAAQSDSIFPSQKRVKTVSVRADGSVVDGGGDARQPSARVLPAMVAGAPGASVSPAAITAASAPAAPAPARTPAAKATDRATTTTEAALKAPTHARSAVPAPTADAPSGEAGGFAVQLSGTPVESEARAAANSLSAKYASALQGHKATFVEAKVGDKTIYRVRVGHLTEDNAKSMCAAIKAQGGSCFVAKN